MTKKYFMFVPFPRGTKNTDLSPTNPKITSWQDQKDFTVVYSDDQDMNVFNLNGDTRDVSIYVRGHGQPDADYVMSENKANCQTKVSVEALCEMLIKRGLQKEFSGKIKFYNCDSAGPIPNGKNDAAKGVIDMGNQIACRGASYLRAKGFTHAKYVGYIGWIPGTYKTDNSIDGAGIHKWRGGGNPRASTQQYIIPSDFNNATSTTYYPCNIL